MGIFVGAILTTVAARHLYLARKVQFIAANRHFSPAWPLNCRKKAVYQPTLAIEYLAPIGTWYGGWRQAAIARCADAIALSDRASLATIEWLESRIQVEETVANEQLAAES